ncbi:ATP-binding cassette domain-containing protein [Streptomyces sp. NPDC058964]|uniref:ATP-binding cassette domain-containing protein n=1 Tax=Streptomyces sp. NPDC058964 TaxID=3346681 RepID=UPI003674D450
MLVRLGAWSVLEAAQTFLVGYALARALDRGFLAGRAGAGLLWLAWAGAGVVVGAYGTGRVYGVVAALVEPVRDRLVERVVARGVREADGGVLSALTQQVEIARDTLAGLVMVSRSFVFTALGALVGLGSLAPPLLLVVVPPLAAGLGLFAVTLRPLARRQEALLLADEALAADLGTVCPGLRDITAAGAERHVATRTGSLVDAELHAARSLAHWGVLRVASLAVGGQLPGVLLLAAAPWLLGHGVTPGDLVGALAYVTQSLLPALQNLVHGVGTSGARLTVVLRRLLRSPAAPGDGGTPVPAGPDAPGAATAAFLGAGDAGHGATGASGDHAGRSRTDPHATGIPRPGPAEHPRPAAPFPAGPLGAPGTPPHRTAPNPDPQANGPIATDHHTASPRRERAALDLTSVTFAYGTAREPILDGLDLTVPHGGRLAVVGPSGIGKSTLTALVAGLLEPARGRIRICGHAVPGAGALSLRVLVPQEAYVFTGTLAENLGYFRAGPVPEGELLAAAGAVGLAPLLESRGGAPARGVPARRAAVAPLLESLGGPSARVDPAALSAGERQLIALTRAHLSHAPLVLLDEATCHLDPEAEARAELAFAQRPGGSLVVVAHRISSARRADRILVMDGRCTAYGTHDELLRTSSPYRDLVGGWTPAPAAAPSEPPLAP